MSDDLTDAGRHVRAVAATGNDVMSPWRFVPCAREHEPGRVCVRPDGHDAKPVYDAGMSNPTPDLGPGLDAEIDEAMKDPAYAAAVHDHEARVELIDRLVTARLNAGLSSAQVADAMGVPRGWLRKFEHGDEGTAYPLATVQQYARAVGFRLVVVLADPEGA